MIVVRIWEGLGNQMFQYAYARALQLRTGKKVYLDADRIYKDVLEHKGVRRQYTLDKFNINLPLIENIERKFFFLEQRGTIYKLIFKLAEKRCWFLGFHKEKDIWYKEEQRYSPGNCYLMGWFQDERYFLEYRDILLKDFTPKKKIKISKKLRNILKTETTVSVHIRRTDFKKFGLELPVTYYVNAKQIMEEKIQNPYYIVFTDAEEWVRQELDFGERVFYMCEEGLEDYEELMVMSSCTHNIIANSTFSWWGAWLNRNKSKIVVGPKKWANQMPKSIQYNIMPKEWIEIG